MVQRRDLVGGGLVAGFGALVSSAASPAEAAAQDCDLSAVQSALGRLTAVFDRHFDQPWRRVAQVRAQQRPWIRAHRSYPQFIEIGLDVWDDLHDWHVRHQLPLNVSRQADGQYVMAFHFTTLILRPDLDPGHVGPPFDQRQG